MSKSIAIRFGDKEQAIFEHLNNQPNKSKYIKDLIRHDMDQQQHELDQSLKNYIDEQIDLKLNNK